MYQEGIKLVKVQVGGREQMKEDNKETKKPSKIDIIGELLKKNFKNGEIKCELHYLGTKRII